MGNIAGIEKRPLGKLRIILKCIWKNGLWECGLDPIGSGYDPLASPC